MEVRNRADQRSDPGRARRVRHVRDRVPRRGLGGSGLHQGLHRQRPGGHHRHGQHAHVVLQRGPEVRRRAQRDRVRHGPQQQRAVDGLGRRRQRLVDVQLEHRPADSASGRAGPLCEALLHGALAAGGRRHCPQRPPPAAPCLRGRPAPDTGARNRVKFKTPGLNDYVTLTAGRVEDALDTTNGVAREYQGIVDVTSLVATGGAGVYGVANVQLGTGLDADHAGGWALAVAYEDSSKPTRNLTIFDGFRFVLANGAPVDIPLSGFVTPKSGPVTTNIGLVAIEGDLGTTGDSATINADASGSAASGSCPPILPGRPCRLTNPANPANNFFNASIADRNGVTFTQRDPAFPNQMGFDADIVGATRNLANDQTSTTLRLATDGDGFAPNAVSFATDLFAPSLLVNKAVSPTGAVDLGAPLTYTVDVTNTGLDAAR